MKPAEATNREKAHCSTAAPNPWKQQEEGKRERVQHSGRSRGARRGNSKCHSELRSHCSEL